MTYMTVTTERMVVTFLGKLFHYELRKELVRRKRARILWSMYLQLKGAVTKLATVGWGSKVTYPHSSLVSADWTKRKPISYHNRAHPLILHLRTSASQPVRQSGSQLLCNRLTAQFNCFAAF